jgi:hypothetical protein
MDTPVSTSTTYGNDLALNVAAPIDRVRWASVLAGLFTVLATLATLTVLGLALGLSTFDANAPQDFGYGAGIYGAISAIIGFLLGGFVAARTGAVAGTGNGLLNGAMVWIVTVVLIVNFLGTGIGTLLGTAGQVATTAVEVAGDAAAVAATNPELVATAQSALPTPAGDAGAPAATTAPGDVAGAVAPIVEDVQNQLEDVTPAEVNRVARDVSNGAWAALLALGLTALASILGGILGTRSYPTDVATYKS